MRLRLQTNKQQYDSKKKKKEEEEYDRQLQHISSRCLMLERQNSELQGIAMNACQRMVKKTNEVSELREKLAQATSVLRRMCTELERMRALQPPGKAPELLPPLLATKYPESPPPTVSLS